MAEIAELARLDYANILDYDSEERTPRLRLMKNQIVRSQIIADYTFVDEMLGSAICHYFFGKKMGFIKLWRTKKFRTFNYYVLEVLSLTEKLRFVKAITKVPKPVAADIEALNALRNGLAHAFFPENLRSAKPIYKGKDIFSRDGLKRFIEDMSRVSNFFVSFNFGVRRRSASNNLRQEAEGAALRSSSNTDAVQL
ncbi:MAG: hypothetical protein ACRD50_04780 [Candidatus Acidiferrales bacterium]